MPSDLSRRAMVVGGRAGIGKHIADRLSAAGYEIIIAGSGELVGAHTLELDNTDGPSCRECLARLHDEIGAVDCLVNCTVTPVRGVNGPFASADPNAFAEAARLSVAAMFELVHRSLSSAASAGRCHCAVRVRFSPLFLAQPERRRCHQQPLSQHLPATSRSKQRRTKWG